MKEFIKENWFKVAIVIILTMIVSAYALGQYAYYQKQQAQIQLGKEKQEQLKLEKERENKEKKEKIIDLENCLTLVEERVDRLFKNNFKNCDTMSGINSECLNEIEIGAEKIRKEGKSECFKKYPQ